VVREVRLIAHWSRLSATEVQLDAVPNQIAVARASLMRGWLALVIAALLVVPSFAQGL